MFAFRHLLSVCQTVHENYMKTDRHYDSQITGCCVMMLVWIDRALFEGSLIALKKEKDTLSLYCIYLNVLTFLQRLDKKTSLIWASQRASLLDLKCHTVLLMSPRIDKLCNTVCRQPTPDEHSIAVNTIPRLDRQPPASSHRYPVLWV